ncbi:MAG: hypothetical protein K8S13_13825 [Desulfobacula sp.]|uniref:hypothetical protein n=1 Tax=Desulfobacula sp. TaxID=2593537 RepID=UPI0025C5C853|nr:hypothetical protein [Desulfobacula sp.]MCD4720919.1 hypothetical protein [Desulfobacula sp.]
MAEKITAYQFSKQFKKAYTALPEKVKKTFDQKIQLFMQDMSHPSLRVKRIQGTKTQWEGSITMKYRFTFEYIDNKLIFRAIGTHDIFNREAK